MKIAVISTTVLPCPPPGYSGLEMIAYHQAAGLAKKGHKVLLVATKESKPPHGVDLHGTTQGEAEKAAYGGYWDRLLGVDAIIDNSWNKWAYVLKSEGKFAGPVLGVLHAPIETMYGSKPPVEKPCFVAISNDQAGAVAGHLAAEARVAYNGVDMDFYKPNGEERTSRYLFLARMSKLKGPHIAVSVAKKCKVALDLVGDDTLVEDPGYAVRVKESCDGPRIVYHGAKSRDQCVSFFSSARALLHLNFVYREPFGLSPIEAMACGTPVIAADYGAMRETIDPSTGFLVKTPEEVEAIVKSDAASKIKPADCREWAAQFSVSKMVDRYEALVKEAIDIGW